MPAPKKPAAQDYYYENAPLREVIVEIHWPLYSLAALPGSGIDPFHESILTGFSAKAAANKFVAVEPRLAASFPVEMQGHKAVRLFRTAPNAWPCYQIGPGVFTANMVPPYKGWATFRPHLQKGLEWLIDSHPNPTQFQLESVELRYLNVFTSLHGLSDPAEFINRTLGLAVTLPPAIVKTAAKGGHLRLAGEVRIPLETPTGAVGFINWAEALVDNESAVTMDLVVRVQRPGLIANSKQIVELVDVARTTATTWFETLVVKKLGQHIGAKVVQ